MTTPDNVNCSYEEVDRPWGRYKVLHELPGTKVKELTVNPGCKLSMQRHEFRSEYWFVAEGACQVETEFAEFQLYAHDEMLKIPKHGWHQLKNPFDKPCKIVEIQYGERCEEEDIERRQN